MYDGKPHNSLFQSRFGDEPCRAAQESHDFNRGRCQEKDGSDETGTAVLGFWIKNVIIDENGEVDVDGHAYSITMTAYDSLEAFKKNEVDRYSNEYDIYEFPVNW